MVDRMVGLVVGVGEVVVVPPPVAVVILHLRRAVGGDVDLDRDTGLKQGDFNKHFPPIRFHTLCRYTSTALTSRWPGTWWW